MALWDKRDDESESDFVAFKCYRDQPPPRNLRRTAQMLVDHTLMTVIELCNKFDWRARVKEWDAFCDKTLQDEHLAYLRQTANQRAAEHLMVLKDAREFLTIEMRKLLARAEDCPTSTVKPEILAKLLELVVKYERLVTGEATENVAQNVDFSGLTPEELRQAYDLLQKGAGGKPLLSPAPAAKKSVS